jgi:hypothetical protein
MTTISPDRLLEALPVLYRLRDIDQGRPLQTLLRALGEQAEILRQDVDRLWDDFFIETCRDWVVPYIGDLVANNAIHDAGTRARVDVAKTIYYRRRKGTLPMLEELARDITGWGAHAVEFFELLGWTQNLNHLRFQAGWPDIRDIDVMDRIDGGFDQVSHTVDIKPPGTVEGWHNIKNVGFFLYRLQSYPAQGVVLTDAGGDEHAVRPQPRVAAAPHLFHFSSVGAPAPLFNRWRREGDEAGLATEPFVPGPIRPTAFMRDLDRLVADPVAALDYYGAASLAGGGLDECGAPITAVLSGGSVAVFADGSEVPGERILCKDLSTWEAPPAGSDTVAVDVAMGRLAFAPDAVPETIGVEYHYGFEGNVGGGPYDRRRPEPEAEEFKGWGPDTVADPSAFGSEPITVAAVASDHVSIQDAIDEWLAGPTRPPVVIEIGDDRTYIEDITIDVTDASRIVVQAANERRPTLVGSITITGDNPDARVVVDGLQVEGDLALTGNLAEVRLAHCTLIPGRALDEDGAPVAPNEPSVVAEVTNTALRLVVYRSIVGALRLPEEMTGLVALQSIIDGLDISAVAATGTDDAAGPPSDLRQVTVLGEVHVRSLLMASEVIFDAPLHAERTQEGCVRFSYVAPGSTTPRRYRCQPDLALDLPGLSAGERARIEAGLRPAYTSIHYHDPGYTQLGIKCPDEIRTGAEDGSEMGVWSFLRNPQRETNLRIRLDEYLPFGLEPALIYVT